MIRLPLTAILALVAVGVPLRAANPTDVEFFEAKIRPVLVESCGTCHASGPKAPKGGLALDTRDGLFKGGDSGPAVVPGKPDESLLIKALRHDDLRMPPKRKLPDAVIADFITWVRNGAIDPRTAAARTGPNFAKAREFWSFRPVREPAPPAVAHPEWARTAVDRFVLARLESEHLHPVAPADKRTLLRRATFDLTGLPPTPEDVEVFVADPSPDAFARRVDCLLASPAYGERWARFWLDVARYAEDQAHTFGVQPNVHAWRYRDWVINAFNADMPYDRFVRLQIAADLIPGAEAERLRDLPALGFFGLGAQYYKNSDAAKAAADELDDRVDTLCRGFLGLTVSCARCHDHKFDPIPTKDYYSLAGVFQSSRLARVSLAPADVVAHFDEAQANVRREEERVKKFTQDLKVGVAEGMKGEVANYLMAAYVCRSGKAAPAAVNPGEIAKERKLDVESLRRWVRFLESNKLAGTPVLDAWRALPAPAKGSRDVPAAVAEAARAFQHQVEAATARRNKAGGAKSDAELLKTIYAGDQALFPVSDAMLTSRLTPAQRRQLDDLKAGVEARKKALPPEYAVAHGLADAGATDLNVYVRGNPARQGEAAPRRFLRVIAGDDPPRFTKGSGRLELAEAIVAPTNPLTARVMVNRIWQHHFGRGIVGTPSNFGELGDRPTHPDLLDYLAARFVAGGWSVKALHREIMLSATYQAGTGVDPADAARDPDNRWLWRQNRRRLDIEAYRDALLAVAGQLDPARGGPSVDLRPADNRRRTVYARISRHELDGVLRLFDFPDANITSEKRSETTVAQQQLFVLNSPFMAERAKGFAARLRSESADAAGRARQAFLLAFGRPPTPAETDLALRFVSTADPADEAGKNQLDRWQRLAHVLLASNEFITID